MKTTGVVTDSHSGIARDEAEKLGIRILPMPFYFDEECYYEELDITREEFFRKLESGVHVTTSQPSPESVKKLWDEALEEYREILYFPISSGLSGSCMTAMALAGDEKYRGRVFVVDNGRVATPMHRAILDALELIGEGYPAADIRRMLEADRDRMAIYIAVETLEYLRRGGRITPATAALGSLLNIKPILRIDTGALQAVKKCRGFKSAKHAMMEALHQDLETRFDDLDYAGDVYLMAASSASDEATAEWIGEIEASFPGKKVLCDRLSFGVSCHTGPGALGVGFSCRPKRRPSDQG